MRVHNWALVSELNSKERCSYFTNCFGMSLVNICRRWSRSLGRYALRLSLPVSILGCASFELSWAAPVLPNLIGDHMVLQRAREIHIWGMADAGEDIKATFTQNTTPLTQNSEC